MYTGKDGESFDSPASSPIGYANSGISFDMTRQGDTEWKARCLWLGRVLGIAFRDREDIFVLLAKQSVKIEKEKL